MVFDALTPEPIVVDLLLEGAAVDGVDATPPALSAIDRTASLGVGLPTLASDG
jgi:hypothetical protein